MVLSALEGVVGHQRVLGLLEGEVARPAHAYLLVGPAGVGKGTVARRFAAALLCRQRGEHAGAPCRDCRRVLEGSHPDLVLVEPDARTVLSVDQARTTIARAVLSPVEAGRKVFLFEEAGSMSEEAANALLKTLEEPTPTTVFLLVAESEEALPSTVASRSRTVFFGRVAEDDVVAALAGLGIEEDQGRQAARISGGRPGLAMKLATRPEVAEYRRAWLSIPMRVSARAGEAVRLAREVLAAREPLLEELSGRQRREMEALDRDAPEAQRRALAERHRRELRREEQALLVTGLEILASWYRDAAAAQFGVPVRNHDVPATALAAVSAAQAVERAERILRAVETVEGYQRQELVLSTLFADLGAD